MDPHAENYYSISPYAYVANNPLKYTDPTGMDWYLNQTNGELYYNQDFTDGNITYNNLQYIRIGANNMMGDMGKITEKAYSYSESQNLANENNYSINPIQQIEQRIWREYTDGGRTPGSSTREEYTLINEKYSIFSNKETHQMQFNKKTEIFSQPIRLLNALMTLGGTKTADERSRRYYTYLNEESSKNRNEGLIDGSRPKGSFVNTYTSWENYRTATGGKGVLLQYRSK